MKIGDTCVTLAELGISEDNAKKKFGPKTSYELATISDVRVIHRRNEDEITYRGETYMRTKKGARMEWISRVPSDKTLNR
jgi:hypothetical protein